MRGIRRSQILGVLLIGVPWVASPTFAGDRDDDGDSDNRATIDNLVIRPDKRGPRLRLDNQFGETFVTLKKPKRLLVPTAKDLVTAPALLPLPRDGRPLQVLRRQGRQDPWASDQLNPVRTFGVKKPKTLCAPAGVDAGSILHPDDHLLCYEIKLVRGSCAAVSPKNAGGVCKKEKDCGGKDKGKKKTSLCQKQPKDRKIEAFLINDFGPSLVKVKKVKELCVPSKKTIL